MALAVSLSLYLSIHFAIVLAWEQQKSSRILWLLEMLMAKTISRLIFLFARSLSLSLPLGIESTWETWLKLYNLQSTLITNSELDIVSSFGTFCQPAPSALEKESSSFPSTVFMWANVYTEVLFDRTLVIHFSIHIVLLPPSLFHLPLFIGRYQENFSTFPLLYMLEVVAYWQINNDVTAEKGRDPKIWESIDRGRFLLTRHTIMSFVCDPFTESTVLVGMKLSRRSLAAESNRKIFTLHSLLVM